MYSYRLRLLVSVSSMGLAVGIVLLSFFATAEAASGTSCLDILESDPTRSLPSGTYIIEPDGSTDAHSVWCDMTTDGGGWTSITPEIAHIYLNGTLTAVDEVKYAGITDDHQPYSRSKRNAPNKKKQTYYYTFDMPFGDGITEFYFNDYRAKAFALDNNNDTSDLKGSSDFIQTDWDIAYNTGDDGEKLAGDISFGSANEDGPLTSFARVLSATSCADCFLEWPNETVYTFPDPVDSFRIGWGEYGSQGEGWYPWWDGEIRVREREPTDAIENLTIEFPTNGTTITTTSTIISGYGTTVGGYVRVDDVASAQTICQGLVNSNYQWSCTASSLTPGSHTLSAIEYTARNIEIDRESVSVNVQAPYDIPTYSLQITNPPFGTTVVGTPAIQGVGNPNYYVNILSDTNAFSCYAQIAINGSWSCIPSPTPTTPGVYPFTASIRATSNGAVITTAPGQFIIPDTTIPTVPTIPIIPNTSTTTISDIGLCDLYLTDHMRLGVSANPAEVTKLQTYLNTREGESLTLSGVYDTPTFQAVRRYQVKYARDILMPWGMTEASGYVYKTTLAHINRTMCQSSIQCPVFDTYQKQGSAGPEVSKIQRFLSMFGYYSGQISGYFDEATFKAIKSFQEEFRPMVLDPWNLSEPTGYWYKTTRKHANWLQGCFETVDVEGRVF